MYNKTYILIDVGEEKLKKINILFFKRIRTPLKFQLFFLTNSDECSK